MEKAKFKIDDKVKIVKIMDSMTNESLIGKIGHIEKIEPLPNGDFNYDFRANSGSCYYMHEEELEIVTGTRKRDQDCWNCGRIAAVLKSKQPCPDRPISQMPVYCTSWIPILPQPEPPPTGAMLIAAERERQMSQEAYDAAHDDKHHTGDLVAAARCYALLAHCQAYPGIHKEEIKSLFYGPSDEWPFDEGYWRPNINPIQNLKKAGALIAAEIDRLYRAERVTRVK